MYDRQEKKCEKVFDIMITYMSKNFFLPTNGDNMFCFRREKKIKSTLASWKLPTLLQGHTAHVRIIKILFSFYKK